MFSVLVQRFVDYSLFLLWATIAIWSSSNLAAENHNEAIESFTLSIDAGQVSASIESVPLETVLDALSEQTGISLSIDLEVIDEPISAYFEQRLLSDAIHSLLQGLNYSVFYDKVLTADGQLISQVVEIYVLPSDIEFSSYDIITSAETEALLNRLWRATNTEQRIAALQAIAQHDLSRRISTLADLLTDADKALLTPFNERVATLDMALAGSDLLSELIMTDDDPAIRRQALQLLSEIGRDADTAITDLSVQQRHHGYHLFKQHHDQQLQDAVHIAMVDDDPNVREAALETIESGQLDGVIPTQTLQQMTLTDPDPNLRMTALEFLIDADQANASYYLQQSITNDPNAEVRELAWDLAEEVSAGDSQ